MSGEMCEKSTKKQRSYYHNSYTFRPNYISEKLALTVCVCVCVTPIDIRVPYSSTATHWLYIILKFCFVIGSFEFLESQNFNMPNKWI